MSDYTCPFCNMRMSRIEGNNIAYECKYDNFSVDFSHRTAWFSIKVKNHLMESQRFLEQFYESEPAFVLGRAPLFHKDFKLEDCIFVNCVTESDNVECIKDFSSKTSLIRRPILLGGQYNLADDFVKNFFMGMKLGAAGPVIYTKENRLKPREYLFQKFLLHNTDTFMDVSDVVTLNAYFSPTLEGTLVNLFSMYITGKVEEIVPDTTALYSVLFNNCYLNIVHDNSMEVLYKNCKEYVKACLKDLDKHLMDTCKVPSLDQKIVREAYIAYMSTMPQLYVNLEEVDRENMATFDIMNMEHAKMPSIIDIALDHRILNLYDMLKAIHVTNCPNTTKYGLKFKSDYLDDHRVMYDKSNANDILFKFWTAIRKEFFTDETMD